MGTAAPTSAQCPSLCVKNGSGPVFYGVGRDDGIGSTLGKIILHLATAWKYSVRFGGFLYLCPEGKHGEEFYQTLSMMLGFDYDVLRPQGEPINLRDVFAWMRKS